MEIYQNKHLLIDGDILIRRSAEIAVKTQYLCTDYNHSKICDSHEELKQTQSTWTGETEVWLREVDQGIDFTKLVLDNSLSAIVGKLLPDGATTYISGRDCFRYKVAVSRLYKVSREIYGKPKHYRELLNYFGEKHGYELTDGIEADDAIGIATEQYGDGCIICSIDKDMDQLAGWHYDWVKDRVYRVSQREADFNLYRQILSGDSTDGIPGLPGVGPKTAQKLLSGAKSTEDLFEMVWNAYRDRLGDISDGDKWDYFREQSKLIYVLRTHIDEKEIAFGTAGDHFYFLPGYNHDLCPHYKNSEVKPNEQLQIG